MIEEHFIYFPDRTLLADPGAAGLGFEELRPRAADGTRLSCWLVPGAGGPTVLWLHGNAGNIGDRVAHLGGLHGELGATVMMVGYRGYGTSEGKPTEQGLYMDARAALEALAAGTGTPPDQVVLFGQSLGAAVAVELARSHPPRALVLESAFTSIREMARHHYWWLPVWPLLRTRFDSLAKIGAVDAPKLIMHGESDQIAPPEMGERLHAAALEPKRLVLVPDAGHNDLDLVAPRAYYAAWRQLLAGA